VEKKEKPAAKVAKGDLDSELSDLLSGVDD
jgi:hypothetical protein